MTAGASGARGERSVRVGGDVVGSVIVTGDNNNLNLVVGDAHGALLEQLARDRKPIKRLRTQPLAPVPPCPAGSIDRDSEARAILDALRSQAPVGLVGPKGIGKTHAILRALNADDPALAQGAAYVFAPGSLDDVMQVLFEAWYQCDPPCKPSNPQLRHDLAEIRGAVALDGVELDRDGAQQVTLAAEGCRVVIASRARVLWDGTPIPLQGLEGDYAVAVLEQELGRPLAEGEREPAARICAALEGHPLKIREAVAFARDAGRSLVTLADSLSTGDPDAVLGREKLDAAGEDGRRLLAALALFSDATVGRDHLRAIAGVADFDQALMAALGRRDVRAHSPRYTLGASTSQGAVELDLAPAGERALTHFTAWAERNRRRPGVVLTEGPALLSLLRWAVESGRNRDAIRLGRAIDHAFALGRRFGAWGEVLQIVRGAARSTQDRRAEAWTLHQLGTRAICLGNIDAGVALLNEAIEPRRALGDTAGAQRSARNAGIAKRPSWFTRWIVGHSLLMGLAVALLAAGGVLAAVLPGNVHHQVSGVPSSNSKPASPTPNRGNRSASNPGGNGPQPTKGGRSGATDTGGAPTAHLSVTVMGPGQVRIDPPGRVCSAGAPCHPLAARPGSVMVLSSIPSDGATLSSWQNAECPDPTSTCQIVMKEDESAAPQFIQETQLTVKVDPHLKATVTSTPDGISCTAGSTCSHPFPADTQVTLTSADPVSWSTDGPPPCPSTALTTFKVPQGSSPVEVSVWPPSVC